jgi:hypothetical protein
VSRFGSFADLGLDFGGFQGSETEPLYGGQDVVCRFGPDEGLGIGVDGLDVARDRRFEFGGERWTPRRICFSVRLAKMHSTWLTQEAEVGVKCTCQRGRLANQLRIASVLWLDTLSMTIWTSWFAGTLQRGVPQPEASTALCPWRWRFAIAEADEKRVADRKTAGIRRMPSKLGS